MLIESVFSNPPTKIWGTFPLVPSLFSKRKGGRLNSGKNPLTRSSKRFIDSPKPSCVCLLLLHYKRAWNPGALFTFIFVSPLFRLKGGGVHCVPRRIRRWNPCGRCERLHSLCGGLISCEILCSCCATLPVTAHDPTGVFAESGYFTHR